MRTIKLIVAAMIVAATNMEIATAENVTGKAVNSLNVDRQLDYCSAQVGKSLANMKKNGAIDYSRIPKDILDEQQSWNLQTICPENWTCGFWPGVLWMDYAYTKDENVKRGLSMVTPCAIVRLRTRDTWSLRKR